MNYINTAIDVVRDRLFSELVAFSANPEELPNFLTVLEEFAINSAAVLDTRTRANLPALMEKFDPSWTSLLIDCSMELQIRMESELAGSYTELRDVIISACKRVGNSMLIPKEGWEVDAEIMNDRLDDATVLRFVIGHCYIDVAFKVNEILTAWRANNERSEQSKASVA